MKTISKFIILFFFGQLLTSCFTSEKNKNDTIVIEKDVVPIEINNQYRLSVPKYMTKAYDLNDDASLQYQNIYKETYIVVIDEPKDNMVATFKESGEYNDALSVIKNYKDIQLQILSESIDITMTSNPKSAQINGLDAEFAEFDGKVAGIEFGISYFLTFIEGKENVYMIMAWTLKNRKEKYKKTFEMAAQSFRLIDRPVIEKDVVPIEINNQYKLSVPEYMTKAYDLNNEASLQYQNIYKETYIVVIDEPKDNMVAIYKELGEYNDALSVVKNYKDIQLQNLSESIDITMTSNPKSAQINGLDAEFAEFDGKIAGIKFDISYFLTFIEGKENMYMIMAWTLKNRKEKYKKTFEKASKSFRLIDN